jgi:hypothetical protein
VSKVQNTFRYDPDAHYRLVCEMLRTRDQHFISFICGLLQVRAARSLTHPHTHQHDTHAAPSD